MGRRGPAPKPTRLRVIQGNPGKRPLNKNEPKPALGRPPCPRWLNEEAKKEWRRIVPELARIGVLTIVDRLALAGYCQAYARWRQAEEAIEKYGMIGKTESGYVQQLPYVSIAQKSLALMRNLAAEFGMTPSSRSRIKADTSEKDKDPFEEFLGGRRSAP